MTDVKCDVSGFTAALGRMKDLRAFYAAVGNRMVASMMQNFRAGGRPSKWVPLSDATLEVLARSMLRKGRGKKAVAKALRGRAVLVGRGELWASIEYRATKKGVTIGSALPYASIHQFGGQAGRGKKVHIPARPYAVVQDDDNAWINSCLERHVTR